MTLFATFQATLQESDALKPGDPLVVGVSGGADSIALLHLFTRAREILDIRPYVLHVNHQIRKEEADDDAQFVESVCAEWRVPCRVVTADVPALAARHKLSLEEAARQARYTALAGEAGRIGAGAIAVAMIPREQKALIRKKTKIVVFSSTILMHRYPGVRLKKGWNESGPKVLSLALSAGSRLPFQ